MDDDVFPFIIGCSDQFSQNKFFYLISSSMRKVKNDIDNTVFAKAFQNLKKSLQFRFGGTWYQTLYTKQIPL